MLKKLRSALGIPRASLLPLTLKTIGFGILLYLASQNPVYFLIFLLGVIYFYFRKPFNSREFISSFFILILSSLISLSYVPLREEIGAWPVVIFYSILMLILIGIKNIVFIHREFWYFILNSFLSGALMMFFFVSDKSHLFFLKYLFFGAGIFLLFKEFLVFNFDTITITPNHPVLGKKNLISLSLTYLTMQFVWVLSLLPLGFINTSALGILFMLVLEDLILNNWNGTLNKRLILRNLTIFLLLTLTIFGFSRWSL